MTTKQKQQCPECKELFFNNAILAMHRKNKHGIEGKSASTAYLNKQRAKKAAEANAATASSQVVSPLASVFGRHRCDQCEYETTTAHGLRVHVSTKHRKKIETTIDAQQQPPTGGTSIERIEAAPLKRAYTRRAREENGSHYSDGISEATLALALGRYQGFCASMAQEFDLPPRRFAARLAELIYATQVRT